MKYVKVILWAVVSIGCIVCIVIFNGGQWISGICGLVGGLSLPKVYETTVDLSDNTNWKTSQRKLQRGQYIRKNTIIRISFAYLFRIRCGNHYLLVLNERGTGKYQPVGGVYKASPEEIEYLKNKYNALDDDKIPLDIASEGDYRMRIANKHLRAFMRRFDSKKCQRENIADLSREFQEELMKTGIIKWKKLQYRFRGRHIAELRYSESIRKYELLLADIVEVILNNKQIQDLEKLKNTPSDKYMFATETEIRALGTHVENNDLMETIGGNALKILPENEQTLMRIANYGRIFTVDL